MRLFKSLILTIFLFSLKAEGQTIQYKALLDTAIKFRGLFVSSRPITTISLDKNDIRNNDYLKEVWKNADSTTLFEIIENSKNMDTTSWSDNELGDFILVQNRDQDVELSYAIDKFNLTDKKKLRYYRKQINDFNSAIPFDKNIYYYSRPVFDNSKKFAIVEWDNGHGGLGGGGGIELYKMTGNTWSDLGLIATWRH